MDRHAILWLALDIRPIYSQTLLFINLYHMDQQIRTIYAAAAKAQQENPTDCGNLEPFLLELRAFKIPFALANLLDMEYFGCNGEYWREAIA